MIAALLLFVASQATAAAPPDWGRLPPLRYSHRPDLPAGLDAFVRDEVAAGRCVLPHDDGTLRIELAVLVDGGAVIRVVPRAIACPTVEQFAAGLLSRIARDDLDPVSPDGWYRATLDLAVKRSTRG